MSRIDWLSPEEISLVRDDLDLACKQLVSVLYKISGRAPARVIDKALRAEERLWRFATNVVDALQPPHNHYNR